MHGDLLEAIRGNCNVVVCPSAALDPGAVARHLQGNGVTPLLLPPGSDANRLRYYASRQATILVPDVTSAGGVDAVQRLMFANYPSIVAWTSIECASIEDWLWQAADETGLLPSGHTVDYTAYFIATRVLGNDARASGKEWSFHRCQRTG